jgi:glutaredoxin 3|tara:strand:+ start:3067 stop:3342 length:276 start_codon:yes stop_codon:yes gene_type:complete
MSEVAIMNDARKAGTDFLMYTGNFCGYCTAAKRLFNQKQISFTELNFDAGEAKRREIVAATGHRTVPVILDLRQDQPIFIGGFDELQVYLS